jgi:hypothetical protein
MFKVGDRVKIKEDFFVTFGFQDDLVDSTQDSEPIRIKLSKLISLSETYVISEYVQETNEYKLNLSSNSFSIIILERIQFLPNYLELVIKTYRNL